MTDETYNANDPAFRLSRALDRDLSDQEQRRLDAELDSSAALRECARQLHTVDRLVMRWGKRRPALDGDDLVRRVAARLADAPASSKQFGLDRLLRRWAASRPAVDDGAFAEAVAGRLKKETPAAPPRRRTNVFFRIGAPLAAAAAIVLAATTGLWFAPDDAPVVHVVLQRSLEISPLVGRSETSTRVKVSFARRPVELRPVMRSRPGISFAAVGVSPGDLDEQDAPPL